MLSLDRSGRKFMEVMTRAEQRDPSPTLSTRDDVIAPQLIRVRHRHSHLTFKETDARERS